MTLYCVKWSKTRVIGIIAAISVLIWPIAHECMYLKATINCRVLILAEIICALIFIPQRKFA